MELACCGAVQLLRLLQTGAVSAAEVTAAYLKRIRLQEPRVGAFLCILEPQALRQAEIIDEKRRRGQPLGPLAGIPVALKDNLCTKDAPTTCASRMLKGFYPPYDAAVVERLLAADAVLLGKTNLDEFAMGSTCEYSALQATRNPRDLSRVPGGSSGGSAAAVAALETPLALGSDTGGSVRLPAAWCGVVGLRPSYGAVSRYGLVAFASSMDQVGPLARSVADAELLYQVICGPDGRDATSKRFPPPELPSAPRVGLPLEYFARADPAVAAAVQAAVRQVFPCALECSLPATGAALDAYLILSAAEASSNLARYDGVRYGPAGAGDVFLQKARAARNEGFGPEARRRILLGTFALSAAGNEAYYQRAARVREQVRAEFARAFARFDLLITPTAGRTAPRFGTYADDPAAMYATDLCTVGASLAGLPALSIPCGSDAAGLPIGLQLLGAPGAEPLLFAAARRIEALQEGGGAAP